VHLYGSADLEGIHWTIELKGLGSSKTFTTVEVVPRPITVDGRSLRWTHPDWIDLGQEGSTSHAPLVRTITIVTDGPRTGVDYSVELRPSLNGLNDSTGPPITLELPIQSFDGSSTPAPAATAAIAALALARMRRRKD
jgi:MYXO-CTERM domain-containing protein